MVYIDITLPKECKCCNFTCVNYNFGIAERKCIFNGINITHMVGRNHNCPLTKVHTKKGKR